MAETTYDRTKPQKRFTAAVSRGLRESAVLAIGVIALVMLVRAGLLSPRQIRRSPRRAVAIMRSATCIGPFGAWLSDILFFLFGRPAYLFPRHAGRGLLRDVPAAR